MREGAPKFCLALNKIISCLVKRLRALKAEHEKATVAEVQTGSVNWERSVVCLKRKCDNCGKAGVKEKHLTRVYGRGRNALVIENVRIIVCPHCGASYLEAKTLHEIERIKRHRKSFAKQKPFDVATFAL